MRAAKKNSDGYIYPLTPALAERKTEFTIGEYDPEKKSFKPDASEQEPQEVTPEAPAAPVEPAAPEAAVDDPKPKGKGKRG